MSMIISNLLACALLALVVGVLAPFSLGQAGPAYTTRAVTEDADREAARVVEMLAEPPSTPVLRDRNSRYMLRPGDVVQIDFLLAPSLNQTQSVQPDGYMALQNAGEIHAAGKTVPELTDALREKYRTIMHDPQLTVVLKDFERPYFVASGQIAKPGKYELRGATTVSQAIAMAGGFGDVAKTSRVLLFRRVSGDSVTLKQLDLKKMLGDGDFREDTELKAGDLLYVPKSVSASVFKAILPRTATGLYLPLRVE